MANKLDLADAQFVGFRHGKWHREDIIGLIESMGLTKKEWIDWKENYPLSLDNSDITEIDEYFGLI